MAIMIRNNKYYMKGKIRRLDGSLYCYTKLITGTTSKKKMAEIERAFRKQFETNELYAVIDFNALCDEFMLSYRQVKASTKMTKEQDLKRPRAAFGNVSVTDIDSKSLQLYIYELEKDLSEKSVKKIFYAIKSVFDFAVDNNYLLKNPMKTVVRTINRDKPKQEMLYLTEDQFTTLCKYAEDDEYTLLFKFLFYMGCRRGEALALTWVDIDLRARTVTIGKSVSFKTRPATITTPKTKNSYRTISMPEVVWTALSNEKERHREMYGWSEERFVFGYHKPLDPENIRRRLKAIIKRANDDKQKLPDIRIHDFRHSHASYLINNMSDKFTDFDVANRLGDTVQTLHDTYVHWYKQADRAIIEVIDNKPKEPVKADYKTELIELKELLTLEVITPEEFAAKKKQLLGI